MENLDKRPEDVPKKKRRKKGQGLYLLGLVVVLFLVMYLAGMVYMWIEEKENQTEDVMSDALSMEEVPGIPEVTYTQAELDKLLDEAVERARNEAEDAERERILGQLAAELSDGNTVVETLRPLYPDCIVAASGGRYHFVPIKDNLKKHTLKQENLLVLENGEFQYMEGDAKVSHKGIDVSRHQGAIDWQRVGQTDVEFVIIRVGYRGYGNGRMAEDEQFVSNIEGALKAGLKVGVYYFSQAVTIEEAKEEAAYVLEQIAPYKVEMPVVFDVEKVSDKQGRMNLISVEERTNVTLAFCEAIEAAGYTPMIYHNMEMGALLIDLEPLEKYEKWFAFYGPDIYYPYEFQIWQYSDEGSVDGISGAVDMNISFKMWGE